MKWYHIIFALLNIVMVGLWIKDGPLTMLFVNVPLAAYFSWQAWRHIKKEREQ